MVNMSDFRNLPGYPKLDTLEPLLQAYWILAIAEDKLAIKHLSAKQLSNLAEQLKIDLPALAISRAFARVRGEIKAKKEGDIYYSLMEKGRNRLLGKILKREDVQELFSQELLKKFGEKFQKDFNQLSINFTNNCGDGVAFFLRKILEKTIYKVFAKQNKLDALKDKGGKFLGLDKMLKIASNEEVAGEPIMLARTYKNVAGIKFLGDTAAHNFIINVDMPEIIPQLPFIITAFKEIADKM
jgi:hypothetical protein